jgi:hypothetical protein
MSESISQEFCKSLTRLSDCSPELTATTEDGGDNDDVASSWVLLGYSCQLEYVLLLHGAASEEENTKARNKVLKFLPDMCNKCLLHLRRTEVRQSFFVYYLH